MKIMAKRTRRVDENGIDWRTPRLCFNQHGKIRVGFLLDNMCAPILVWSQALLERALRLWGPRERKG